MPARKNRPDKHTGPSTPRVVKPEDQLAQWAQQNPRMIVHRLKGGPAWEVLSGSLHDGFFATVSWDGIQRRWAITHNMVPDLGSERYTFKTLDAAITWYTTLRTQRA